MRRLPEPLQTWVRRTLAILGILGRGTLELGAETWGFLKDNVLTRAVGRLYRRSRVYFITTCLLALFIFLYFLPHFVVTVKPGEAGVEWSRFAGGTVLDRIYPEGTHLKNPFNTVFIYNVRKQEMAHEMKALTVNGLDVGVQLSIRYHPQYDFLPILHQKIGPGYAQAIVLPEVEAEIRRVIGRFTPEELFTTQGGVLERLVQGAFGQVGENFVTLDDVVVKRIVLPDKLVNAIESKLTQEQLMLEYAFRLDRESKEAERRRIEATGIRDYHRTIASSLTSDVLAWEGVRATRDLASSENAKVIVIGNGRDNLPIMLSPGSP